MLQADPSKVSARAKKRGLPQVITRRLSKEMKSNVVIIVFDG